METTIRSHPGIRRVDWLIGRSFPTVYYTLVMDTDTSPHDAQGVLTTQTARQVDRLVPVLQDELDSRFPEAQILVRSFGQGPPVQADVQYRSFGPDIETLRELGQTVRRKLQSHPDALHTMVTRLRGEPKVCLRADEDEAGSPQPETGTDDWQAYGPHRGRVVHREPVASNVNLYVVEKPEGFTFEPGQAVELCIDQPGWREEKRPFTITSLPSNPRLEFVIKSYPTDRHPEHDGMTEHLGRDIQVGDRVIFSDAWGAIRYRGPGIFIAGGAGVTPFIAILRHLEQTQRLEGNRLFFSNKTADEVFLQGEFMRTLGRGVVCTLTQQQHRDYEHGRIDRQWLEHRIHDYSQHFYVCGPPKMIEDVCRILREQGASPDSLVLEED